MASRAILSALILAHLSKLYVCVCTSGDACPAVAASMLQTKQFVDGDTAVTTVMSEREYLRSVAWSQAQSMNLASKFHRAAKKLPQASATKELLDSFRICGKCQNFQRWGEAHDGGYLMCMDGFQKAPVTVAYSLGVEKHDQWSEDVVKNLGVPVIQFDCTVDASDCKSCKFFKKCIVAADGNHPVPGHATEGWSLEEAMSNTLLAKSDLLAQIPDGSLLMKMDIESSEWPIYGSEPPEVLKKFGQLIVEFHGLHDESRHAEYLQAMHHISDAGFKVAHLHGNNFEGMYKTGTEVIPRVIEVTFVHGEAMPKGCVSDQLYEQLDAPNNAGAPELPMAHLK